MNSFTIRFANEKDTSSIMQFINDNWREKHILSLNRELFNWQYYNNNKLHFVLGIDEENKIQGLIGYIDYDIGDKKDIALALWKSNPGCGYLGIQILMYLMKNEPHRAIVCTGINIQTTELLYKKLGFHIDKMKQWYRLSPKECYHIASIRNPLIPSVCNTETIESTKCNSVDDIPTDVFSNDASIPYKSKEYIKWRYFNHPIYKYLVYKISFSARNKIAIVVLRIDQVEERRALRLVDYIGDKADFTFITSKLDDILNQYNAEYIDMYEYGLSDMELTKAGWLCVDDSDNIIPNYFSPFELRNIDIYICTTNENAILFKGDGDQDRPN